MEGQANTMDLYTRALPLGATDTLIGNPTLPMPSVWFYAVQQYNQIKGQKAEKAHECIRAGKLDEAVALQGAENYGDPQGNLIYRQKIANVLNKINNLPPEHQYGPDNVAFVAGATGALNSFTKFLSKGKVIGTTFPRHVWHETENMYPITDETGKLTAQSLENALKKAKLEGVHIDELIFCDPNNPMGYSVGRTQWTKIADVLRKKENAHLLVTIDEAYAEVDFKSHVSLVEVAPDLKDRLTIIRTIGKGFSGTGNRVGVALAHPDRVQELMGPNIDVYFKVAPDKQYAYSETLDWYADNRDIWRQTMDNFYGTQVRYVTDRAKDMGTDFKAKGYDPNIFYVIQDFSSVKGSKLNDEAASVLGKKEGDTAKTDVDIAYDIFHEKGIALYPLSWYGANPDSALLRITCGQGPEKLKEVMDHLESYVQEKSLNTKTPQERETTESHVSRLAAEENRCWSLWG